MDADNRLIDIVEDHAIICDVLVRINIALSSGRDLPYVIPVLNDTEMTDHLTRIVEHLKKTRHE